MTLTDEQREALAYVREMVRRHPLEMCQDAVSKRHTALTRFAIESIDALLVDKEPT